METETETEFHDWLVARRRDFHKHPELAWQETRTTDIIEAHLHEMGIATRRFEDMTGIVGDLPFGDGDGKTVALRADIDALPIRETADSSYTSENDGVMHACGHDANTAIMLGAAKQLTARDTGEGLKGHVRFLFQPAEERAGGAAAMIERGVLENPRIDWIFAGHMDPELPAGTVGLFRNQGYAAADRFRLLLKGRGSHGGRPEMGVDPIVAGSAFVTAAQTVVSRNVRPIEPAVISFGRFVSGNVSNVIPETAQLEGTIRSHASDVRDLIFSRLREIADGIARTHGVTAELDLVEGVPSCANDTEVSDFLKRVAGQVIGEENVKALSPIMGAEDFAYFTRHRPAAVLRLGCTPPNAIRPVSLHSPHFDIDEGVLKIGALIFTRAVTELLKTG